VLPEHRSSLHQESGRDSCTRGRVCPQTPHGQSTISAEGEGLSLSTTRHTGMSSRLPSGDDHPSPALSSTRGSSLPAAPARPRRRLPESLSRRDCQRWSALNLLPTKPARIQAGSSARVAVPSSCSCHQAAQKHQLPRCRLTTAFI